MPDKRLGERGCAFATLKFSEHLTFVDMIAHLQDYKLTRNHLPVRLEVVDQTFVIKRGSIIEKR